MSTLAMHGQRGTPLLMPCHARWASLSVDMTHELPYPMPIAHNTSCSSSAPICTALQGGKVYDSKYGVTCHWCRQKTLEDHVTCTSEACGKGKRLATTFW